MDEKTKAKQIAAACKNDCTELYLLKGLSIINAAGNV